MSRFLLSFLPYTSFLSVLLFFPASVHADVVKLKDGQAHQGTITAEEEERIQLKLEGNGARIWFQKDQIESIERDSEKEEEQKEEKGESPATSEDASDDITRARELLKKMREQPQANRLKQSSSPASTESNEASAATAPSGDSTEIQNLIEQLRKGNFYDRLNACKKLGELGAKEAIPDFIHFLDDENFTIRQESNKSLIKITGEDFGFNPSNKRELRVEAINRWNEWYKAEKKKESHLNLKSFW